MNGIVIPEVVMGVALAKAGIDRIRPHMIGQPAGSALPATVFLNSNESIFGPSALAVTAARAAFTGIERYLETPDQLLVPAIATRFDLDPDRIAIGQGSDDLLARLARAYLGPGTELIRSANGYLKVPNYAYANDADVVSVPDNEFVPSVDGLISAITEKTRIVYLANPENPAGTYLSGAELRRLHAALPETVLLVIDCAYAEYAEASDYEPAHRLVEQSQNVVMCRTFSKVYGLAGARVGWIYAPVDVVDAVRRIALTFPVATPSVAAAIAALDDRAHTQAVIDMNRRGRAWMSAQMQALGLSVIPSQANFVLVHFPDPEFPATAVDATLRQRGIAIRRLAAPAYREFIRITIGHDHDLLRTRDVISGFLDGSA